MSDQIPRAPAKSTDVDALQFAKLEQKGFFLTQEVYASKFEMWMIGTGQNHKIKNDVIQQLIIGVNCGPKQAIEVRNFHFQESIQVIIMYTDTLLF